MSSVCRKCNGKYSNQCDLILHREIHKITENVVSESNDQKSGTLSYVKTYVYQYDGTDCLYKNVIYRCASCSKEFLYKNRCKAHMKTHEQTYECALRDKVLTCKRYLKEHLQLHTHETPYQCAICNEPFLRKDKLIAHGRTHTKKAKENVEPLDHLLPGKTFFKCKLCPKQYTRKQHLDLHQLYHSANDLPYECEYCGQRCLRKDHLIRHEDVHKYDAATNKCLCAVCGEWFLNHLLKPHIIANHSDVMKFKCDKCDKAFKKKGNLIYHKQSHLNLYLTSLIIRASEY